MIGPLLFSLNQNLIFFNRKLDNDDEKEESPENASEKTSKVYSDRKLTDEGPLPWCQSDDLVFVRTHHMFSRIQNFLFVIVFSEIFFVFLIQITVILAFYNLFWFLNEPIKANERFHGKKNQVS